jgi:hypothetical protein
MLVRSNYLKIKNKIAAVLPFSVIKTGGFL